MQVVELGDPFVDEVRGWRGASRSPRCRQPHSRYVRAGRGTFDIGLFAMKAGGVS